MEQNFAVAAMLRGSKEEAVTVNIRFWEDIWQSG